ncbi:MAG: helix-turn-helix domain-containing protein [Thiomicrospira sp.]
MEKAMQPPSNTAKQAESHFSATDGGNPILKINTAREAAFMAELLADTPSTRQLSTKTGATNAPDVIYKLRKRGWKIKTVYEWVETRYKEKVRAGRYELNPQQMDAARLALSAFRSKHG